MRRVIRKTSTVQGLAAASVVVGAAVLGASGVSVFRSSFPDRRSIWELVFADSTTVGFVRLAVIALALYATASSAALLVGRRWMKGLGTGGLQVDDARETDDLVQQYKDRARTAEEARDEAIRIVNEVTRWLNQT